MEGAALREVAPRMKASLRRLGLPGSLRSGAKQLQPPPSQARQGDLAPDVGGRRRAA